MSIKQEPGTVTRDLTEVEPSYMYSDVNIKSKNEKSFLQIKTGCSFEEENSTSPDITISQEQWHESANTNIKDHVSTLNASNSHECHFDNVEKETSAMPNMQSSNSFLTDTQYEDKGVLLQHQMVIKSEPVMPTDNSIDDKFYESMDVDFHEYHPTTRSSYNAATNQEDQVKLYKCGICPYSSNHLFDLYQHNISHAKANSYKCDLCQSSYQDFLDLKFHVISHAVDDKISYGNKKTLIQDDTRKHLCDFIRLQPNQLKQNKRRRTGEKQFSCDVCDYICRHSYRLKQHRRKHTGERPYSCDVCDYTCAKPSTLKQHKRRHTGEKPYACDFCHYTCARSSVLKIHKRTHTGERPYSCDLCDYTCSQPATLQQHKRKHTGERPYSCDLCNYTCARSSNLIRHKRKHTGEKPYFCNHCKYTCAQLSNLIRHKRKH